MEPWHLTIAAKGRTTLFPESDALTAAARTVARVAGERLLLFCIVDDHAHIVVIGDRTDASVAASAMSRAFRAAGSPELQPTYVRPVEGRAHLERLVGYFARQVDKHGLGGHGALWPGSCAPDLLGVRRLPGFDPGRIDRALPRYAVRSAVIDAYGVWRGALVPATSLPEPAKLLAIALRAVAASRRGNEPHVLAAVIAWAHLSDAPAAALAEVSGAGSSTIQRLRRRPVDVELAEIVRRRASLEAWVRTLEVGAHKLQHDRASPDL